MSARHDHWMVHASQWAHVGQPLRPGPIDVGIAESMARQASTIVGHASPRALVLGVTPELVGMGWPQGTRLISVDRCPGMIGRVLPRAGQGRVIGICGNWLQLPLASGSLDLIAGDGCFTVLETLADHGAFSAELARVLAGGFLIMRLFVRPDQAETIEQVFDALEAGQIGNFHIFKWRLAMALHQDLGSGVAVADIWKAWQSSGLDSASLALAQGWPVADIETIRAYENATARYTFPRIHEAREVLSRDFAELDCQLPDYELGERCPTLLLRAKS